MIGVVCVLFKNFFKKILKLFCRYKNNDYLCPMEQYPLVINVVVYIL